ncbi:GNAT family N-acetyltransferase [bacterium]|nr:GNAT family N-acetyltransferase [bacterium]
MPRVVLRPATAADTAVCGRICYDAFAAIAAQHNFPPDFPSAEFAESVLAGMLRHEEVTATAAVVDGTVVGSCFVTDTGPIAAIGPITVSPAAQDAAIGRHLMEHALDDATRRGFVGVRLVQAAYHGRSMALYAKLGFEVREPLACMQGAPLALTVPGHAVRPAGPDDAERCNVLHFRVHGHTRQPEVADAIRQGLATVVERDGRLTGYATLLGFPGHAVGETNADLQALIGAAPMFFGPGFLVPTRNGDLFRWCLSQGLRVTQPLTLMSLGLYNEPRGAFLPSVLF